MQAPVIPLVVHLMIMFLKQKIQCYSVCSHTARAYVNYNPSDPHADPPTGRKLLCYNTEEDNRLNESDKEDTDAQEDPSAALQSAVKESFRKR